jgi:hypothetical protein
MRLVRPWIVLIAVCAAGASWALPEPAPRATVSATAPEGGSAPALKAVYERLRGNLESNAFGRPLVLQSSESGRAQNGDVYAVVDYPFAAVEKGLSEAQSWCDVMILPYNTKHCHATGSGANTILTMRIGRKADQAPEDAHPIAFKYTVPSQAADYLRVVLDAAEGPLGTRDYRIVLEATPVDGKRTFIRLGYSYGFSALSKFAMQAYLATAGAKKVGFTVTGKDREGNPVHVGGMLGATERNTMRYFLAIDVYLASLAVPEAQRVEKRLNDWYAASGKYPRQLSEMERAEYLAMKRRETSRLKEAL